MQWKGLITVMIWIQMIKKPKDEMEDLHNSIASPCIYQNCLAVRTEDLVQSTILFPFGGVGKKEYTKKESIQGTVTLICTSKQKVLFSKLKENVCY